MFVHPFSLLVSLEFLLILKCFNGVSRPFKGCLNFKGSFEEVLRVFTESFKGFQGNLKSVSRKFQECSRKFRPTEFELSLQVSFTIFGKN